MAGSVTRQRRALEFDGALDQVEYVTDSRFGLAVPTSCPNVPSQILTPKNTSADGDAYDVQAHKFAHLFRSNFEPYKENNTSAIGRMAFTSRSGTRKKEG